MQLYKKMGKSLGLTKNINKGTLIVGQHKSSPKGTEWLYMFVGMMACIEKLTS